MKLYLNLNKNKIFLGIFFLDIFFLQKICLAQAKNFRVTDVLGSSLTVLNLNYQTQLAELDVIKSNTLNLKFELNSTDSELFGEAHGCRIGTSAILDRYIKVLLDDRPTIRVRSANQSIRLSAQIENPNHQVGNINCGYVALFSSSTPTPVIEIRIFGDVIPSPVWKSGLNTNPSMVLFSFAGLTSQSADNVTVSSSTVPVQLLHPLTNPANVFISRPQACSIGKSRVRDNDVAIVVGSRELLNDASVLFADGQDQFLKLQFNANGGYGKNHGNVQCEKNGSLVYAY